MLSLTIELAAPQSINGKRASYQSLWLLVRLIYARRHEAATSVVRLAELRQQFTDARTLRMFVSRAFRDFAQWRVQVGWGEDVHTDPRFLNLDRRSQGPFWLPAGEDEKITCMVNGKPATQAELLRFLHLKRQPVAAPSAPTAVQPDYWLALAGAQQQLREGRLLAALDGSARRSNNGALAGFKLAARSASSRVQHALAVLGEAQVWRRLDDLEAARKTLVRLRRMLKEGGADEGGYLDAMEQILSAWCAYTERDLALTEALLLAMGQAEPRASVVRHHPRIRFEWNNLMALVRRAQALASDEPGTRDAGAAEAIRLFGAALDAAFEVASFDAAQQAAANIGMAAWLFACEGIGPVSDAQAVRPDAVRWLVLSEWLCQCAGAAGQSAWNAIYLMRIARGDCVNEEWPSMTAFRAQQPISPCDMARYAAGPVDLLNAASWMDVAARLLAQQREQRYGLLQRCGLLLEHAWYAVHYGGADTAHASLGLLMSEMRQLPASDKAFFQAELRRFPPEIATGLKT